MNDIMASRALQIEGVDHHQRFRMALTQEASILLLAFPEALQHSARFRRYYLKQIH